MITFRNSNGVAFHAFDAHAAQAVRRDSFNQVKLSSGGAMFRYQHKETGKVWQTVCTQKAPHETYGDSVKVRLVAICVEHTPSPVTFRGYGLHVGDVTDCASLVEGYSEDCHALAQHEEHMEAEQKVRCQATTQAGKQCKNVAQEGTLYCHTHQGIKYTPWKKAA